jgi:branched-subunit amino acid transport protein
MEKIWFIMIALGIGTFLIRFSMIALFGSLNLSASFERALRFVPASVLFALVISQLVNCSRPPCLSWSNPQIWASAVAGLIAWKTQNAFLTILGGMIALWMIRMLLSG